MRDQSLRCFSRLVLLLFATLPGTAFGSTYAPVAEVLFSGNAMNLHKADLIWQGVPWIARRGM